MLLSDAICYTLLTITITATCVSGESTQQELADRKSERRNKREAAVLVDSLSSSTYKEKPDVIYKRLSKVRYRQPKPKYSPPKAKYGPPLKAKYGPPRKAKYGPPIKSKYGPPPKRQIKKYRRKQVRANKFKKRSPKPNYGSYHKVTYYKPTKAPQLPQRYYASEPTGFGEPPKNFTTQYVQRPQQSYGEPPVDSYGNPLKPNTIHSTAEPFEQTPNYENFGQQYQSYQSYQQDLNVDNINAYSKDQPTFAKPEVGYFDEEQITMNQKKYVNLDLDSYADVFKQSSQNDLGKQKLKLSPNIQKNRPWKSKVINEVEPSDHIVVGGQYAEPPGRLVPNFQPSAPMHTVSDEFAPPHSYVDSRLATSASKSPYINYKNSNMAFNPQNLNDAFSIY